MFRYWGACFYEIRWRIQPSFLLHGCIRKVSSIAMKGGGGGWVEGIQTIILPLTAEFGVVNKKGPM